MAMSLRCFSDTAGIQAIYTMKGVVDKKKGLDAGSVPAHSQEGGGLIEADFD